MSDLGIGEYYARKDRETRESLNEIRRLRTLLESTERTVEYFRKRLREAEARHLRIADTGD